MKKGVLELYFRDTLMSWNERLNKRKMPWKGEADPYKIWLSEIILQQTRVEQGWEYYNRFIQTYPTVKKLAAAPQEDVFKLWEGLGYYIRCKNLLVSANYIAKDLKGRFPDTYEDILKLKGVGPYTAAAIASFAYNAPFAVVDGNVSRVLARFFDIETPIDSASGKTFFAALAQRLLDKENAALYNQAIMDFGATVCKPQLPLCESCVLKKGCKAFQLGKVNALPVKEKKIIKKQRWLYYIIAEHNNGFYIRQRINKDVWQNLHEFILIEMDRFEDAQAIIDSKEFKNIIPGNYSIIRPPVFYKQLLTHQVINGCFIHIKLNKKTAIEGYTLLSKKDAVKLAFPRLINTYLTEYKTLDD